MAATVLSISDASSGIFPHGDGSSGSINLDSSTFSGVLRGAGCAASDISTNDGSEVAFNLVNHLHTKIAAQTATINGADKVRVGTSESLAGTTLTKTYTFSFDLNFSDVSTLNVKDE